VKPMNFSVDDGPHNSDGLLLHGRNGDQQVTAFISRRVIGDWVDPRQPYGGKESLYREQYKGTRQAKPRRNRTNCDIQISARPVVQSPIPVCGYSTVRHYRKRRGA
jgi:hypothetical protein